MNQESSPPAENRLPPWRRSLRRFFQWVWVEVGIGILVVISVALTLYEFVTENRLGGFELALQSETFQRVVLINDFITYLFIVELSLRFLGSASKKQFFGEFWLDILAVLPEFRAFRSFRAMRLLRLFRILRFFGVATRIANHFPTIFRRGTTEYVVMCGLLVVTVIFSTILIMSFERGTVNDQTPASEQFTFENSFWFSVYSLFAGEPTPMTPTTRLGRIVTVFVMFMGLTIFAMFTGTVSAYMVETFRVEKNSFDLDDVENHIIICGWNTKTEIIIKEFRASSRSRSQPIIVIADVDLGNLGVPDEITKEFLFVRDDFTRVTALERAQVKRAKTCIILADISNGRSEQDADARTILAALTCESMNPAVYTCAELMNRSYGGHLDLGRVNDYVVSGEYAGYMLAQAALNHGLMGVLEELLTHQHGQVFHRVRVPDNWAGKNYLECMVELKSRHNATLVAVQHQNGEMNVNPDEHIFEAEDEIVIMSKGEISL
ncbi:MAG: ion transporter [Planctomycetota bacterium]|nr:ion transporter [Planctomycetota bacterium]